MKRAGKREATRSTNGASTNGHTNGHLANDSYTRGLKGSVFLNHLHHTLVPIFLMLFSPNLVILLWYTAAKCDGSFQLLWHRLTDQGLMAGVTKIWTDIHIGSALSVYILLGYMTYAVILMKVLPGPRSEGPTTPKGNTPVYCDNGFLCYLVTMATLVGLTYWLKQRGMSPTIVYDHFDEFLGTLTVFSHILCVILHLKGLMYPSTTDSGSSGNLIFDYYWGTELYPRIFGIDIKVFTNCRFGMTVWPVLVFIFALKSYELHGFVDSMWVSAALQLIYCTKFFWWEAGYMRTIDIMVDRAGFYICWGCLAYVPGLYASVGMYLVNQPVKLGTLVSLVILACGILAIWINYLADHQKQIVRRTDGKCTIWGRQPEVIRARYQLESGESRESLLLVSGYWGLARHFHYVPELTLSFCWSLPGLFSNVMCYTYFIWLVFLLTHRTFRDDAKCGMKYGPFWSEYREKVPYRMIPGLF